MDNPSEKVSRYVEIQKTGKRKSKKGGGEGPFPRSGSVQRTLCCRQHNVRENCTQGSVRGRSGDWPSYLDATKKHKTKKEDRINVRPGKVVYFSGWEPRPGRQASHRVASL